MAREPFRMVTQTAIRERRAIKHYDAGHRMAESEISGLLELAMQAPTAFNLHLLADAAASGLQGHGKETGRANEDRRGDDSARCSGFHDNA